MPTTDPCNQAIRWMGVAARVPGEWQIVRHSLSPSRGRLALIDRYRQRLTVNWTQCRDEPDLERMLADYRAQQFNAHDQADLTDLTGVPGWVGTRRRFAHSGQQITQAVCYDPQTRRLLEATITCPPPGPPDPPPPESTESAGGAGGAGDEGLAARVLGGIEVAEPADAVTRWRAFDLDVTLPARWRLRSTRVNPADVTLTFGQVRTGRWKRTLPTGAEATVRRMGMADVWYDGDGADFLRGQAKGSRFKPQPALYRGRSVLEGRGWEAGPLLKRLTGQLRRRHDLLWRCEACNAVYHLSVRSYRKQPIEAESFGVCCGSGGAACDG